MSCSQAAAQSVVAQVLRSAAEVGHGLVHRGDVPGELIPALEGVLGVADRGVRNDCERLARTRPRPLPSASSGYRLLLRAGCAPDAPGAGIAPTGRIRILVDVGHCQTVLTDGGLPARDGTDACCGTTFSRSAPFSDQETTYRTPAQAARMACGHPVTRNVLGTHAADIRDGIMVPAKIGRAHV